MFTDDLRRAEDASLLRENLRRTCEAYRTKQQEYLRALGKKRRGEHNGIAHGIRGELKGLQMTLDTMRVCM